ncbi:hypothetical protein Taro_014839 [Colocasia esculenta]|uniref:Uncharacterized protein n=1 Tax=Colocasia esculenta TaxID=4460 RepID=A0A843UN42_COLES|nr:hypothetical protein [Colocasia esculenta]
MQSAEQKAAWTMQCCTSFISIHMKKWARKWWACNLFSGPAKDGSWHAKPPAAAGGLLWNPDGSRDF